MDKNVVQFSMRLYAQFRKEGDQWVACSPMLDLFTQGDTKAEAQKHLIEAVQLFVESCYERGVLEDTLKDLGFQTGPPPVASRWSQVGSAVKGAFSGKKTTQIEVPLPFFTMSGRGDAQNHAS